MVDRDNGVSIVMITYGHEDYIEQAINSVLTQKVNFPIELVLSNDSSPDNTDSVVRSLIDSHPKGHLIRYFNHSKNLGMHENFFFAVRKCTGKYICFCEGDDYWTDNDKLQLQYDILENNYDVALVHSNYDIFYQSKFTVEKSYNYNKVIPNGFVYNKLIVENFIATLTVMIRKSSFEEISEKTYDLSKDLPMIDYPLWLLIALENKISYLDKSMACYRYLDNSASHSTDASKLIKFQDKLFEVRELFNNNIKNVPSSVFRKIKADYMYNLLAYLSKYKDHEKKVFSVFFDFHKSNRSFKRTLGSFYYLLVTIFK